MNFPELHSNILLPSDGVEVTIDESNISWYEPDGIYCTVSLKNPKQSTLEEMKVSTEKWIADKKGEKICWLTVVDGKQQSTKEVRDYLAEVLPLTIKALGLIATNMLARMASNLFFRVNKQEYPVKVFANPEEAKEWLRQYL